MQLGADEAGVAAPGGLADHVAVAAEGRFGQLDDAGQVEVGQPQRVAVEHAFVVVEQPLVVPVDGAQCVDRLAKFGDLALIEHARQQHEAFLVQCLQAGGEGVRHGGPRREGLAFSVACVQHFAQAIRGGVKDSELTDQLFWVKGQVIQFVGVIVSGCVVAGWEVFSSVTFDIFDEIGRLPRQDAKHCRRCAGAFPRLRGTARAVLPSQ
ncbi:hypothetical protein D9M69_464900 [compost metagenome]